MIELPITAFVLILVPYGIVIFIGLGWCLHFLVDMITNFSYYKEKAENESFKNYELSHENYELREKIKDIIEKHNIEFKELYEVEDEHKEM